MPSLQLESGADSEHPALQRLMQLDTLVARVQNAMEAGAIEADGDVKHLASTTPTAASIAGGRSFSRRPSTVSMASLREGQLGE
jgi:hypothetical protein